MRNLIFGMSLILSMIGFNLHAQDLILKRLYEDGLSQSGYILIDNQSKEAIVIDPRKDVQEFIDTLSAYDANLKFVTETHIHADYLSGARELAKLTASTLALSQEGPAEWQYKFDYLPLKQGDKLAFGEYFLQVLHTPGHTPESISFLLYSNANKLNPIKAFTGDFLFVGDVGRPDLLEKYEEGDTNSTASAAALYHSIEKFRKLPDDLEIWPGHGAGSFCGKTLSNIPFSTLKAEKLTNPALQYSGKEAEFIKYILADQVVPPPYFKLMKEWNRDGTYCKLVDDRYAVIDASEIKNLIGKGVKVIDTRVRKEVGKGFHPNTIHVELNKGFNNWFAQLVNHKDQVVFIVEKDNEKALAHKLMRVGFDNVLGVVNDISSEHLKSIKYIKAEDLTKAVQRRGIQAWDIRTAKEYAEGHIAGIANLPLLEIKEKASKLDKNQPILIHCQSGARAAIGYSLFESLGFTDITVYDGGINEWKKLGNKLVSE
ncbi:MBL fold metallo-hydrolase [Sphingobacterium sp. FBM7-1]|uniref:MBL fold metallo-hydrolase n=1 Tax=Sphingobacterium sp. FBM7-1 TaxID=2886688 RepID=UPI001D113907|nr:MBL fold metallo-hydrolase [Sphingobacterium sp. FBM7-1]MCC2599421.1 MBL fold metallo-hydrolase [Sphingobacterium sp. FBM7-1]